MALMRSEPDTLTCLAKHLMKQAHQTTFGRFERCSWMLLCAEKSSLCYNVFMMKATFVALPFLCYDTDSVHWLSITEYQQLEEARKGPRIGADLYVCQAYVSRHGSLSVLFKALKFGVFMSGCEFYIFSASLKSILWPVGVQVAKSESSLSFDV